MSATLPSPRQTLLGCRPALCSPRVRSTDREPHTRGQHSSRPHVFMCSLFSPADDSSSEPSHTILIADDHPILRASIRCVLEAIPGLKVVAEADDGEEAW